MHHIRTIILYITAATWASRPLYIHIYIWYIYIYIICKLYRNECIYIHVYIYIIGMIYINIYMYNIHIWYVWIRDKRYVYIFIYNMHTFIMPLYTHVQYTYLRVYSYRVAKTHRMSQVAGHFCERATNYRARLRKMTSTDKAFYDSTPPCFTTHDQNTRTVLYAWWHTLQNHIRTDVWQYIHAI